MAENDSARGSLQFKHQFYEDGGTGTLLDLASACVNAIRMGVALDAIPDVTRARKGGLTSVLFTWTPEDIGDTPEQVQAAVEAAVAAVGSEVPEKATG